MRNRLKKSSNMRILDTYKDNAYICNLFDYEFDYCDVVIVRAGDDNENTSIVCLLLGFEEYTLPKYI